MNAVIIYDDFDEASRTIALLAGRVLRAHETTRWKVRPWRFDQVIHLARADAARAEAAASHLLVLAIGQGQCVPGWLLEWLEQWATHREVQEAVLAIWVDGHDDANPGPAACAVAEIAGRHGLSFSIYDVQPVANESTILIPEAPGRELALSPRLVGDLTGGETPLVPAQTSNES